MKRKAVPFSPEHFPEELRSFVSGFSLYDSSCSQDARVWMLEGKERFFLKSAAAGTLKTGTVRLSFSVFNTVEEVFRFLNITEDLSGQENSARN